MSFPRQAAFFSARDEAKSSHSTLHTALFELQTSHSTLHTSHSTLHTSHCFLHTPNLTLHTSHCALRTPNLNFTLHTSHFTLHTSHFSLLPSHFKPQTCTIRTQPGRAETTHALPQAIQDELSKPDLDAKTQKLHLPSFGVCKQAKSEKKCKQAICRD